MKVVISTTPCKLPTLQGPEAETLQGNENFVGEEHQQRRGELVFTTQLEKGNRKVSANLPNLPSGIYTFRCEFDDTSFHNGTLKIMR